MNRTVFPEGLSPIQFSATKRARLEFISSPYSLRAWTDNSSLKSLIISSVTSEVRWWGQEIGAEPGETISERAVVQAQQTLLGLTTPIDTDLRHTITHNSAGKSRIITCSPVLINTVLLLLRTAHLNTSHSASSWSLSYLVMIACQRWCGVYVSLFRLVKDMRDVCVFPPGVVWFWGCASRECAGSEQWQCRDESVQCRGRAARSGGFTTGLSCQ